MTLEQKTVICSNAFIAWITGEKQGKVVKNDKEIMDLFTSQIILKKFNVFDIDIVLPDMLLLILSVCVDGNPGLFQIILKDLLNSIKKKKGPIKRGYVITTHDFVDCFLIQFPIIEIPEVLAKYEALWDEQKIKRESSNPFKPDNLCDTPEWWEEVMTNG